MQRSQLTLLCFITMFALLVYLISNFSRHGHASVFSNTNSAYAPRYSLYRTNQAKVFIKNYQNAAAQKPKWSPVHDASICVGVISPLETAHHLPATIGSLLEGMNDAEREMLHLKVLIATPDPEMPSAPGEPWLRALVDSVLPHNQAHPKEQVDRLREPGTENAEDKASRRAIDLLSLMNSCVASGTQYILTLDGSFVAADGWLQRSLAALEEIEQHTDRPFYLRLFHAEYLADRPSKPILAMYTFGFGSLVVILALLCLLQARVVPMKKLALSFAIPLALLMLFFAISCFSMLPSRESIVELTHYRGNVQALAFARRHAIQLVEWYGDSPQVGFESSLEEYADDQGYMRFALVPSLMQNLPSNGSELNTDGFEWNSGFERFHAEVLRKEHERFQRHGLIKHIGL